MEIVTSKSGPKPLGPYSQAIRAGEFLFCSGAIALDPATGELTSDDVGEQTRQALRNLAGVLEAGGASFSQVVKTTVFLIDMNDFVAFNRAYGESFPQSPPARSTVAVAGLPKGARVEIEAVAFLKKG